MVNDLDNHAALVVGHIRGSKKLSQIMWDCSQFKMLNHNFHGRFVRKVSFLLIEPKMLRMEMNYQGGRITSILLEDICVAYDCAS